MSVTVEDPGFNHRCGDCIHFKSDKAYYLDGVPYQNNIDMSGWGVCKAFEAPYPVKNTTRRQNCEHYKPLKRSCKK